MAAHRRSAQSDDNDLDVRVRSRDADHRPDAPYAEASRQRSRP